MNKIFMTNLFVIIINLILVNSIISSDKEFDKKTGLLRLDGKTKDGSVVSIEACKVKCPNDEFFKNVFFHSEKFEEMPKYFLYSLKIYFNGEKVVVPSTSVLSVFEPDGISFESKNKNEYTVSIRENAYNASESFILVLYISGNRTTKYSVITPYCQEEPLSETIYNICEF